MESPKTRVQMKMQ